MPHLVAPRPPAGPPPPDQPMPPINGPAEGPYSPAVRLNPPAPTPVPNPTPITPTVPAGDVVHSVRTGRNLIALTFDDGPSAGYTDAVLGILERHQARATFYVVGQNVAADPTRLQRIAAGGHAVGNHSWNHSTLTTLSDAAVASQFSDTSDAIERAIGRRPDTFRPPGGARTSRVDAIAASQGMRDILWSIDTVDWKRPGSTAIYNTVVNNARPGSIVLMHDAGGNRQQTVDALDGMLTTLEQRGYQFVTVPELMAAEGS